LAIELLHDFGLSADKGDFIGGIKRSGIAVV